MDEKTELPVAATQVLVGNASSSSSSSLQDKERSISQNTEPTTSDPEKHADQPKKPSRSLFWTRKKKDKPEATEKPQEKQDPLAHLPDHERLILKRQIDVPPVSVTYKTLFRYASRTDIILMVISAICAIAGGAAMPLMTVVFGNLAGTFQGSFQGTIEPGQFSGQLAHYTLYFVYLGVGEFVTIFVATAGFLYTGEHIARKIRENYLAAILRQNIGYFDKLGAGEITTRITADTNLVQEGVSEKIGLTLTAVATFITAFVIGFIKSWKLTLILSCSIVGIVSVVGVGSKWMVKWNKMALESYARGGTVAEEVISSIRNATAFTTQDKLARQYATFLTTAEHWGVRHKKMLGLMMGVLMCIIYMTYALAFWQGSRFLVSGSSDVSLSDILTILLSIIIGAFSLGNVGPHVSSFVTATAAAGKIFSTIDRVSPLDPSTSVGKTLDTVEGNVELKHIKHIYPSRPEVVVMQDVNLFVPAGKTTALVGASGSGKSTIVGLVERFYDPVGGQVLLDGHDIKDLNLQFLRRQISLVSQEPTLFGTTIFKNIAHGLIGTRYEDVSDDEKEKLVMGAAELANAHGFIGGLPEGYETNVGERGFLLSGGQKQRIAIARAIVSDPKILLLDEATSALDTKSEGVVQAALDNAAKGRTTIIIAHRLSTIKTADNIVVMTEGTIVEQGTHNDLLEKQGAYYKLVEAQRIAATNTGNNPDEVELLEDNDPIQKMASRGSEKNVNPLLRTTTSKSVSSAVLTDRKTSESGVNKYSLWTLIKVVARFNKEEWHYMLVGLLASIIAGSGHPTQSIFFAKSIVALSYPPSQYDLLRSQINFWSWMYFMLALVMFVSYTSQGFAFAYCSERLIHRSRDRSFRTMLRQDIGFFDKEENTAGALTTFLSTETTRLAGLSGSTLGTILNVVTTLVASFILSLAIGWKLALVCIATVPILLGCGYFRFHLLAEFEDRSKKAYEKSASYACEATSAIRTVASLTRERDVWEQYRAQLVAQARASAVSVARSAALYAAAQSFMFLCIALGFWYGGTLIASGEYSLFQFFVCFSAVIFGAQSAGTIFSFAPDMGKAKHAAGQLKTLFDRQPGIDIWDESGEEIKNEAVKGRLEFRDVHFRYPTRPEQPVLKGLNLKVEPGQYVALVGQSGCGKSTTIGLLERFYDPLSGDITLDGYPITGLNIKNYRSHIALVSQEPTLYQGTIKDNVLLGADHPDGVGDDEIEQACADANILTFIRSLPDGFATVVGNKGVMLSGGQKQRVAIARALLRKPKVLLLDEATSALDSESEKVVQAALDHAAKGRTTVAVAHRLSTIQRADCIFVFESGVVVEKGTHNELMKRKGRYFELVGMQSLEKGV